MIFTHFTHEVLHYRFAELFSRTVMFLTLCHIEEGRGRGGGGGQILPNPMENGIITVARRILAPTNFVVCFLKSNGKLVKAKYFSKLETGKRSCFNRY